MKPQVVAWELGKRLRPTMRLSPATPARSPPGGRARSRRSAARCTRCPATLATMACGLPVRHRGTGRVPRSAVGRVRRRRRVLHAHGRVRHVREVQPADQGRRGQEQRRWARSNGSRWCSSATRSSGSSSSRSTSRTSRRRAARTGFRIDDPKECGAVLDQALATARARCSSKPLSMRWSHRCRRRSTSSRRKSSQRRWHAASRTGPRFVRKVIEDRVREMV